VKRLRLQPQSLGPKFYPQVRLVDVVPKQGDWKRLQLRLQPQSLGPKFYPQVRLVDVVPKQGDWNRLDLSE
jgi:hypothetical protein